jgi:hypothetical protein
MLLSYSPVDGSFASICFHYFHTPNVRFPLNQHNTNTGVTPSEEAVNNLIKRYTTLAIEVKGDNTDISELNCGSLSYCQSLGSGTVGNSTDSFPGAGDSKYDTDGDGKGNLEKGPTRDFQLKTNSSLSLINTGDTIIQEVLSPSGVTKKFLGRLNFVFKGTPAFKNVTLNPNDVSSKTFSFNYPLESNPLGSKGNCIPVSPAFTGELKLEIEAWRSQRKGIKAIGESEWVDIGGSEITVDIPNKPCTTNNCSSIRSPNNCSVASYAESDTNLEIIGGKLLDKKLDSPASPANTIKFSLDLTSCLLESGDQFKSGESVEFDLQFRSQAKQSGSDNAAIKLCLINSGGV